LPFSRPNSRPRPLNLIVVGHGRVFRRQGSGVQILAPGVEVGLHPPGLLLAGMTMGFLRNSQKGSQILCR
jgi:hypothetical protein